MFETVIALGSIYIKLIESGNILFKNWTAIIYCNPEELNTVKINFAITDETKNIFGLRKIEGGTISSIIKVQKFLEKCYNEWLEHITKKRDDFPLLNYFTLNQLVVLRTKLSEIKKFKEANKSINLRCLADLLFNINENISCKLIVEANEYACDKASENKLRFNLMNSKEGTLTIEQRRALIEDLEMQGFERSLIEQGLRILKTNNRLQLIQFCIDNEDTDYSSNDQKSDSVQIEFDKLATNKSNSDSLDTKFEEIIARFKDMLEKNYSDFLSLDHIGFMLEYFKSKSTKKINRKVPPFLEAGVANLILIEDDNLMARVLYIYMSSSDQPMPNDDEIMFCNEKTTASDVEIYLRRSLTDCIESESDNKKIYCMVNAHDIPYDQAVKILQIFENLKKRNDFIFCIFCAEEKEDKSVFASAYNRYKRKLPKEINYKEIENYLFKHFKYNYDRAAAAASIEIDRLTTRVIKSERSGVGKSLYIERVYEAITKKFNKTARLCIPVKKKVLCVEDIFEMLKNFDDKHYSQPRLFHLDIAYEVLENVNSFLFQLLCMRVLKSAKDEIWRRSNTDLYLIEIMTPLRKKEENIPRPLHSILIYLPSVNCLTPIQILKRLKGEAEEDYSKCFGQFDKQILESEKIQRPCQYLKAVEDEENVNLNQVKFNPENNLSETECLELLLKHSEIENPSWFELMNFSTFLNIQLGDSEKSAFCCLDDVEKREDEEDILPNFRQFVIKFMIQMSHDFALPSLEVSDISALQINENKEVHFELNQVKMKRKWENHPHPYLFFNPDHISFTFFGFNINKWSGQLVDQIDQMKIVFPNIKLERNLINGIDAQAPGILSQKISNMTKYENIDKILHVMGKSWAMRRQKDKKPYDPDPSYELTMDNVLKIMAIYMRFRCNIPVIIMGETGCGKTRLILYLCDLQKPPPDYNPYEKDKDLRDQYKVPTINNMYLLKVHGGITSKDIISHVRKAQELATRNHKIMKDDETFTVLFFDEANSTEAIGTIKEIICDGRMNGEMIDFSSGLKIIAACNPYKKHSDDVIKSFKSAGLGFYAGESLDTQEKLGNLSMRELVYRVQPLPTSMLPMIWDFGQLNDDVERLYIRQIVESIYKNPESTLNLISEKHLPMIIDILTESQKFMRELKNECSFVSLRNVQRVLVVIQWFMNLDTFLIKKMKKKEAEIHGFEIIDNFDDLVEIDDNSDNDWKSIADDESVCSKGTRGDDNELKIEMFQSDDAPEPYNFNSLVRSIILATSVCYHVSLQSNSTREEYRNKLASCFKLRKITAESIMNLINICQEVFLDEIEKPDAIARNQALKENIFMMVVCIELRIPLFIVGYVFNSIKKLK